MYKLYQYNKCSTCAKAKKYLESKKITSKIIDITETPPNKSELKLMLKFYNGDIKKLFNTSGVQYRELKIKDIIKSMSANEAIELLSQNGKLIKRPFMISKTKGVIGFNEDSWSSL